MNKQHFRYLLLSSLLLVVGLFVWQIIKKKAQPTQQLSQFPALPFYSIIDSIAQTSKTWQGKSVVLIYFNSTCEYCQYEAAQIAKQIDSFQSVVVVWFSIEDVAKIKQFATTYQLANQPSVVFAKVLPQDLSKYFGGVSPPSIWIFDKNQQLVKHFKGETKIEAIVKYL